jgi:peptide/nickel transport system substrate-binding protein
MKFKSQHFLAGVLLMAASACGGTVELDLPFTPAPTTEPAVTLIVPTPEPPPAKTLVVCLGREPASLYRYSVDYLYGPASREADAILEAIYDGPVQMRGYSYEPVILEKLPSLADGDARIESVIVREGEVYFNPDTLEPDNLTIGEKYIPAGCESPLCVQRYGGGGVEMDRMVADFRLLPDVKWSDGEPLTASDSVFSFNLDAEVETPSPKGMIDRTAAYQLVDEFTVRWTGIPGFMDPEYGSNFWSPLPEHRMGALSAVKILESADVNQAPIGWGPYSLVEWLPGQQVVLQRNPHYFRSNEGLPGFDVVLFRFLGEQVDTSAVQLLTGECDLLDETAVANSLGVETLNEHALAELVSLQAEGVQIAWAPGPETERLDLNVAPPFASAATRMFADARVRQAIALCIDRQGFIDTTLMGMSAIAPSYLPPTHPLHDADLLAWEYDPSAGQALLQQAGWIRPEGDTSVRRASGVVGVAAGSAMQITLLTTNIGFQRAMADQLTGDLAECGIDLSVEVVEQIEVFQTWPEGQVFGREFELVSWAWPGWVSPLCEMYASWEIPGADHPIGINASGYFNGEYDRACKILLFAIPEGAAYRQAVADTENILARDLPMIPLYQRPRVVAHIPQLCGVEVDPSAFSVLWNIEEYKLGEECE